MLEGCVAFDDFSASCGDSSLHLPSWELSPVVYHLPHQDELGDAADVLHPKTLEDWGLGNLDTRFFDPYLAEHELVVASVEQPQDETWILFDSGAAANCCPPDFAPEFPLLRLDERAPPLKSISGQTLNIYGRKLVAFEIEGQRLWLNFYVCDVPYSVVSVARLLQQGCKATLTSEGSRLEGPSGEVLPVVRYGSLLFMCPKLASFDPEEYANFSATFHAQFAVRPPPGLVAPTFKPTIQYHADKWVLDSANHTLTRLHKRVRTTLFSPDGTKDRPIELKDLSNERTTFMEFEDGSTTSVTDDWRTSDDPRAMQEKRFKGRTVFKLASVPTGRKLLGKQSTLKPPEPLEVKPQKIKDSKLQVLPPPTSQAPRGNSGSERLQVRLANPKKRSCKTRL